MRKKVVIPYFPVALRFLSPLLLVFAGYLVYNEFVAWAILPVLIAIIILTTHYVTEIDLGAKFYRDYLSFLGMRWSEDRRQFQQVDKITITRTFHSKEIKAQVGSHQMNFHDYTGTLITDGTYRLDLVTSTDKEEVLRGLKEFAEFLNVKVEDQSVTPPYWIDMKKVVFNTEA